MKIIFIQRINLGGGIVSAHYICEKLSKMGHEVSCVAIKPNNSENINFPIGEHSYRIYFLNSFLTNYIFVLANFLKKYLKKEKPDVIISTGPEGAFIKNICKKNKILHVASYHHPNPTFVGKEIFLPRISHLLKPGRWLHQLDIYLERKSLLESDIVHCLCNWHKKITSERLKIPEDKIFVVYLGVDIEKFKPLPRQKDNLYHVLHCGGLTPSKGIKTTLEAVSLAMQKNEKIFLDIIGEAENNNYESLIKKLGVAESIKIFGQISYEKMPEMYSRADCAVFPTNHESFGLAIVEAMSCGLPVIANGVTAVPEIIEDQKSGILMEFNSPEVLAKEVLNLSENSEKAIRISRTARERVENNFTWEKTALGLESLILNNLK